MFITTKSQRIKTMDDIKDIFYESAEPKIEIFTLSEDGNYNLNGRPFLEDSETSRISTLSELFTEWYLFDSSHEKNIPQFLVEEDLTDVFSETEFMDLICGDAYLDKELVYFVKMQIPFDIPLDKLKNINAQHTKEAYLIKHSENIIERTKEIIALRHATRKATIKQNKAKYRATHREQINEYDRMYRATHLERAKEREAQYRATHKEQIKQRDKRYHENNKEKIQKQQKEYYQKTRDQHLERRKKYYAEHKEQCKKAHKEYYQKNKEQRKIKQRQYHAELKQKSEAAKTVCAAYVFLLNLRKTDKEQYVSLYTSQQKPLIGMLKTCPALQNMDKKMCPFYNDKSTQQPEQCCNQKVLELANAKTMLKILANTLKQK